MDCFNRLCPFRQNTTSSCNRCDCLACQNRCKGPVTYTVSNKTLTAEEIAKARDMDGAVVEITFFE